LEQKKEQTIQNLLLRKIIPFLSMPISPDDSIAFQSNIIPLTRLQKMYHLGPASPIETTAEPELLPGLPPSLVADRGEFLLAVRSGMAKFFHTPEC
jgi:hypothetical protein